MNKIKKNTYNNVINKDRIIALDILKVICIFIVFIYHFYMDIDYVHNMYELNTIRDIIIRPNMHFALIACALFMMVSGATLKLNYNGNIKEFYKKRLLRILVPFYIAYFIAFCFKCANLNSTHIFDPSIPKINIMYTIFGMDEYMMSGGVPTFTLGVGEWFLGCIMICYFLFPLIYYLDKKFSYVLFIAFTIYYLFVNFKYESFNYIMPQHFTILCQIYHFYLGIYLMDMIFIEKTNRLFVMLMCVIVFFSYASLTKYDIIDNFKTTIVVLSIFIIFLKFENIFKRFNIFKTISNISSSLSFEFFLIHHIVIYETNILLRFIKLEFEQVICLFIFELMFTLFIAIIINIATKLIYNAFLNMSLCIKNIIDENKSAVRVK